MKRLLALVNEVLWPRGMKCLCCYYASEGELLCPACKKALQAMKLDEAGQGDALIRSVYKYDGIVRQLVHQLKLDCQKDAAEVLAEGMAEMLMEMNLPADTVLTWVTMPSMRRKKRGIDHGRTLCEAVARRTGFTSRQILTRVGNVHTQRGLNREKRLKNVARNIRCEEHITFPVVLIDDVLTTGATVSACTDAMRSAGVPNVLAMTASKVVLKRRFFRIWRG